MNVRDLRAALADLPDEALVMGMDEGASMSSVEKAEFEDVSYDEGGNALSCGSGTLWLRLSEF